jgi:hypothetical protein
MGAGGSPSHRQRTTLTGEFSTTFRVGRKYWCTATYPGSTEDGIGGLSMSWSPRPPRRLTRAEKRDWRRGIQALTDEIAAHDGIPFVVVEI